LDSYPGVSLALNRPATFCHGSAVKGNSTAIQDQELRRNRRRTIYVAKWPGASFWHTFQGREFLPGDPEVSLALNLRLIFVTALP
jgi:hypothetical protein